MKTNHSHTKTQATSSEIDHAVILLKAGKLVAIPTETVYGLAADASNPKAIEKIFKVKGRPAQHPLIVHIASDRELSQWAIDIPDIAYQLTKKFWPGPLTLILKKAPHVSTTITGRQNTIAIRSPKHPITQQLLKEFKGGVAAPSANRFGHVSPTSAKHVREDLGDQIDLILDGGPCKIGLESTILDLTNNPLRILRPGMISAEAISHVIKQPVIIGNQTIQASSPRVPGLLTKHYSPKTFAILVPSDQLLKIVNEQQKQNKKIVVLAHSKKFEKMISSYNVFWITLPLKPKDYAHEMYQQIRKADQMNCDVLIIEDVPSNSKWFAIKDRLTRAATKKKSKNQSQDHSHALHIRYSTLLG